MIRMSYRRSQSERGLPQSPRQPWHLGNIAHGKLICNDLRHCARRPASQNSPIVTPQLPAEEIGKT